MQLFDKGVDDNVNEGMLKKWIIWFEKEYHVTNNNAHDILQYERDNNNNNLSFVHDDDDNINSINNNNNEIWNHTKTYVNRLNNNKENNNNNGLDEKSVIAIIIDNHFLNLKNILNNYKVKWIDINVNLNTKNNLQHIIIFHNHAYHCKNIFIIQKYLHYHYFYILLFYHNNNNEDVICFCKWNWNKY